MEISSETRANSDDFSLPLTPSYIKTINMSWTTFDFSAIIVTLTTVFIIFIFPLAHSYEARERGSVSAAIETMDGSQIRDTLAEMTAAMSEIERREFAAESIPNLGREALERIFDR